MKKALLYIGIGFLAVTVLLLAFWWGQRQGYDWRDGELFSDEEPGPRQIPLCDQVISMNSRGEAVQRFQTWYNTNRPLATKAIAVDGVFGPESRGAADVMKLGQSFSLSELPNAAC